MKREKKPYFRQLKFQIMRKIIESMVLSAILSVCSMLFVFVCMEYLAPAHYVKTIHWYNSVPTAGVCITAILFVMFGVHTFWIYMLLMNEMTDSITVISNGVHDISEGKLSARIKVSSKDELGRLADDINCMAKMIERNIENEKKSNEERYNMITNMSHDLKTPMMSIAGYVNLIREHTYKDESERAEYCEIVAQKTAEMNRVVNQLFEYSKLHSSGFELKPAKVNLYEFTEQILMTFLPQLENRNIRYTYDIAHDIYLNADVGLLKSAFENLISNAVKYAWKGGMLHIEASRSTEIVKIAFQNKGDRIPASEIKDIFSKFYREKKNNKIEGSGCGLYIVKQIMEMHHGEIKVKSCDQLTEFILEFPVFQTYR